MVACSDLFLELIISWQESSWFSTAAGISVPPMKCSACVEQLHTQFALDRARLCASGWDAISLVERLFISLPSVVLEVVIGLRNDSHRSVRRVKAYIIHCDVLPTPGLR
jgi:hypothetical protein